MTTRERNDRDHTKRVSTQPYRTSFARSKLFDDLHNEAVKDGSAKLA